MNLYDMLKFLHIITVVFMAAPLYNLVVVNERLRFGKAHVQVDQYFEAIIRGNSARCYVFQVTALVTGVWLVVQAGPLSVLISNRMLLAKLVLLLALTALLSIVHFTIQPRIDRLLAQASGDTIPAAVAAQIAPWRLRRKRLASVCLFLVITTVLLGLQVFRPFAVWMTVLLLILAGLFAWRVYRTPIRYGWM